MKKQADQHLKLKNGTNPDCPRLHLRIARLKGTKNIANDVVTNFV